WRPRSRGGALFRRALPPSPRGSLGRRDRKKTCARPTATQRGQRPQSSSWLPPQRDLLPEAPLGGDRLANRRATGGGWHEIAARPAAANRQRVGLERADEALVLEATKGSVDRPN